MLNSNFDKKEFDIVGCGEVMLRLSPIGKERISQSESFDKMAGGSELNVVSGISSLGLRTAILTKLPDNEIGKFVKNKIRYSDTSDDYIVYDESDNKRLGIYYYESGAYPRLPTVVYDRKNSSFAGMEFNDIDKNIYESTNFFHTSGITLALNQDVRKVVMDVVKEFKSHGAYISFDVNYRATLWDEKTARETILELLPYLDILFVSEETMRRMFAKTGSVEDMMMEFTNDFPNIKVIGSTMRKVKTATKHSFGSIIYDVDKKEFYSEPPYEDIEVVDRIGSGDAFVGGVLFGLIKFRDIKKAVEFGNAMAAVKNTIAGDMTACDYKEIVKVIEAHKKGNASEMVR